MYIFCVVYVFCIFMWCYNKFPLRVTNVVPHRKQRHSIGGSTFEMLLCFPFFFQNVFFSKCFFFLKCVHTHTHSYRVACFFPKFLLFFNACTHTHTLQQSGMRHSLLSGTRLFSQNPKISGHFWGTSPHARDL